MKKLLMIAPYFLPRRRVGAYRPFKFAIHLQEYGWQPTVVTIDENGGNLTQKENRLLNGVEVTRLTPPFDLTQSHSGSQLTKQDNRQENGRDDSLHNLVARPLLNFVDRNFPVDTWLPFFYFNLGKLKKLIGEVSPDLIWATGDPWSGLWIAGELKRRCSIPFVADFRDPWTLCDVRTTNRSKLALRWDRRKERKMLERSDATIFTADKTKAIYEDFYNQTEINSHTIYNSFDRTLYDDAIGMNGSSGDGKDEWDDAHLHLVFFGKFRELSPATPVIDILAALRELTDTPPRIKIHSYGTLNERDQQYAVSRNVSRHFVIEQPISPEGALSELRKADVLFLSTSEKRDEIIPAKLWDYIAAGKPILSIAPNGEIAGILEETGTGIQFPSGNKKEAADMLKRCIEAKMDGRSLPIPFSYDEERVMKFESRSTTRKLSQILNQLV